ncbi:unnamed protein product [Boreogadus saida]
MRERRASTSPPPTARCAASAPSSRPPYADLLLYCATLNALPHHTSPPPRSASRRGGRENITRLSLKSHSGTAGRQSSLVIHGADFSTTDMDNDSCLCKCALMLTGGWWFDACGPSNLNGMYFAEGQHIGKLNGIKWHYFKGPSYSLRATTMMIRPLDFT